MDEECQRNKPSCNTPAEAEDDSILDFKSPKSKITKTKLSDYTKSNVIKQKKKSATKIKHSVKSKETQPKRSEKRKSSQGSQPSIESSFFKPKNNSDNKDAPSNEKLAFLCPLCFKVFKDVDAQALHMKLCAFKNNISTKKLLDAIELQKRQEDERKSLGLFAAPIIQDKKKLLSRKTNSHEDTDLQLALALSKSLQEAEELDAVSEIERLSEIPNQFASEESESICKTHLEQFGFASNKPVSVIKNKRKKFNGVTTLQKRSHEERNRILTERIAEILMGSEPVTQIQKKEIECNQEIKVQTVIKSHMLQKLCCKEDKLWDKARLTPSRKHFYVRNLSEHIIPQESQIEAKEEDTQFTNACEINDSKLNRKKMEARINEQDSCEISNTNTCIASERCENYEKQFTDTLVMNWGNALNDSSASDIIIFVDNDKHIWAHKLVFYIRCPNLLLEVVPNDVLSFSTIKEKICWFDIPYDIVLGFLEFIYCGVIKKYSNIFKDSASFSSLRNVARKYKVKELFAYIQKKEDETKQAEVQVHNIEDTKRENGSLNISPNKSENLIHDREEVPVYTLSESEEAAKEYVEESITNKSGFLENILKNTSSVSNTQLSLARGFNAQELEETIHAEQFDQTKIGCLTKTNIVRHSNVSPDMFDDENLSYQVMRAQEIEKDEDSDDASSIILNMVGETMDTTNSSKTTNSMSPEDTEKCIDLLSNTPHSSKSQRESVNGHDIKKVKSNLSLFIEQYQKENARSDSYTDSEISMLPVRPKLNRNLFNIKQRDSSNESTRLYESDIVKVWKNSIFNQLNRNTKNSKANVKSISIESDSDNHLRSESMDNLTQSIKYNEENSNEKYANDNSPQTNEDNADEKSITNLRWDDDQDSSVSSDLEIMEDEMSMYTRYKRGHENNSIINYRNFLEKYVLNDSTESCSEDDKSKRKTNTDNKEITVLSNINISSDFLISRQECINQAEKEELISNLAESIETQKHSLQNHRPENSINDRNEDCFSADITSPVISQKNTLAVQKANNSNKLRHSKSESNIDVETIRNNSLISLTQPRVNEFESPESPILVSSSPEVDLDYLNEIGSNRNNTNRNISNHETSDDISHICQKEIYLANVHVSEDTDNNVSDHESNINRLRKYNSDGLHNEARVDMFSTTVSQKNDGLCRTKSCVVTEKSPNTDKSLGTKESNRKFQKKSISESNLSINTKSTKNSSSSSTLCKCGRKKTSKTTSPIIIRDNVTPPPNYDGMKTPELHVELVKYGLKAQKRKRAVKLLTYIYNELHPVICKTPEKLGSEFAVLSSEDEEPPLKKVNYDTNDEDCVDDCRNGLPLSPASTVSIQSSTSIIDEERQIDEPGPMTDDTSNIKDAFYKLIKLKKELHNNILAYQPLCIESLHAMLKEEGFKCKMNTLMDFLDEQCITFYFQEMKQRKRF